MVRMIDAYDVVELIEDLQINGWIKDALIDGIKTMSAPSEPKWIPFMRRKPNAKERVSHPEWEYVLCGRLPKDGQRILVNIKYKGHESVQIDTYYEDFGEHYLDSEYDLCTEATAWMPLPEPYKEERCKDEC